MDDDALWAKAQMGDSAAFEVLFRRHAQTLYDYCFYRLGDWSAAEDMLSVVFLEAWRRRQKQLPVGKVLPWLYGIATNVCRNRRRSQIRYAAAIRRLPPPPPDRDFASDVEDRLRGEQDAKALLRDIGQLPKHHRDVFVLCAWSGLTYDDAATALNLRVGTVRSRLSRARARLRELDAARGHEEMTKRTTLEARNDDLPSNVPK